MPGISDSGNPDDVRIHLEEIVSADDARASAVPAESEQEAEARQSAQLSPALRQRLETVLAKVREAVPGLSDAEVKKLLTTRNARDALKKAQAVLARVDSHLQSVTDERNPEIGRLYGVYGRNPETFAGVYRVIEQCTVENARVLSLPADHADRARAFSPLIARVVSESRQQLRALLGERFTSRAELSQKVAIKGDTLSEAKAVISAVRNHLYANLPLLKKDPDLRDYGFRPVREASRGSDEAENVAPAPNAE